MLFEPCRSSRASDSSFRSYRSAGSRTSFASTSCATTCSPSPRMSMAPRCVKCSMRRFTCSGHSGLGQRMATCPSSFTTAVPHTGQCRGHGDALLVTGALLLVHADDGGDDLAGLLDDDEVTHPDVLALDLLEVVQRGVAHGAAAEEDRLQPRDGRERAGAADLDVDGEQPGLRLLGLVFVGDGPARGLARGAEVALLGERVHLDDRAVGFVGQLLALLVEFTDGFDDFLRGVAMPDEIRPRQPGSLSRAMISLCECKFRVTGIAETVEDDSQRALGDVARDRAA